jgi:hypothetical protein
MTELGETKMRQKESVYRKLYSSLLQRKKDGLALGSSKSSAFDDERQLLAQVVRTETTNLFFGIATTATIFTILRFGPTRIIRQMGGEKAKAMRQAEEDAKHLGTAGVQHRIGKNWNLCRLLRRNSREKNYNSLLNLAMVNSFSRLYRGRLFHVGGLSRV